MRFTSLLVLFCAASAAKSSIGCKHVENASEKITELLKDVGITTNNQKWRTEFPDAVIEFYEDNSQKPKIAYLVMTDVKNLQMHNLATESLKNAGNVEAFIDVLANVVCFNDKKFIYTFISPSELVNEIFTFIKPDAIEILIKNIFENLDNKTKMPMELGNSDKTTQEYIVNNKANLEKVASFGALDMSNYILNNMVYYNKNLPAHKLKALNDALQKVDEAHKRVSAGSTTFFDVNTNKPKPLNVVLLKHWLKFLNKQN